MFVQEKTVIFFVFELSWMDISYVVYVHALMSAR